MSILIVLVKVWLAILALRASGGTIQSIDTRGDTSVVVCTDVACATVDAESFSLTVLLTVGGTRT